MKIGIDARFYGHTGIGRYIKNFLIELEKLDKTNEYVIFLKKDNFDLYQPISSNFKKVLADFNWYSFKEQISFPLILYREKLDLLHVPHFNVPILYLKNVVITVHDLIMHKFSTEEATTLNPLYYKFKRLVYRLVVHYAFARALRIIVPSVCVKDQLISQTNLNVSEKISVIYEGLDSFFISGAFDQKIFNKFTYETGLQKPYLLYVGSSYPHKNLKDLVIAFKGLKDKNLFSGNLVIVGKRDQFLVNLKQFAKNLGTENYIVFPSFYEGYSYISDDILAGLYTNASAFIHPSLEEGFNLTPLEAMAFGLPCALSDICVHQEIYNGSALYFNPKSINAIEEALVKLVSDKKLITNLKVKSEKIVEKYSFSKMAKGILEVYEKLKLPKNSPGS